MYRRAQLCTHVCVCAGVHVCIVQACAGVCRLGLPPSPVFLYGSALLWPQRILHHKRPNRGAFLSEDFDTEKSPLSYIDMREFSGNI